MNLFKKLGWCKLCFIRIQRYFHKKSPAQGEALDLYVLTRSQTNFHTHIEVERKT